MPEDDLFIRQRTLMILCVVPASPVLREKTVAHSLMRGIPVSMKVISSAIVDMRVRIIPMIAVSS